METPEEIKEPVFDIPENYFADFERRITAKIAEREKAGKRKTIRMYAVRIAAVAAVMTGVIFSVKVHFGIYLSERKTDSVVTSGIGNGVGYNTEKQHERDTP